MKKKILVKNNYGVHLLSPLMDFTLCGDADEGGYLEDELTSIENVPDGEVTCKQCLAIISTVKEYLYRSKRRTEPKFTKPIFPVGSAWAATTERKDYVIIWLDGVEGGMEIWKWKYLYADGSGQDFGWGPTFTSCKRQAPKLYSPGSLKPIRYKRIR